jgi:predicted neutral ceramidase superfamily lipid hydrolase
MMFLLAICWIFSIFFIIRLLSSNRSKWSKVVYCLVLAVPFVGVLLYLFLSENVPPQSECLRDNGPRGSYTDKIISIKAVLDSMEDGKNKNN